MKAELVFLFFHVIFQITESSKKSLQCRDESGKVVDWYALYKIPKIAENGNSLIKGGVGYLYITNDTVASGWKLSRNSIGAHSSIPGQTLSPLYNDAIAEKSAWIIYNDQPPNNRSLPFKYGHSKGVIMANKGSGFWLIHSVPNFPPMPNTGVEKKRRGSTDASTDALGSMSPGRYSYPESGETNGQSFLCISVDSSQIGDIVQQLMYNQIISYKYNVPQSLSQYSIFVNATKHKKMQPPYNSRKSIQSAGGVEFVSFAKTDQWDKDLYDDFVAPQLQSDMLAETWLNGRGKLPSECNSSKVLNVQAVTLTAANVEFKSTRDHSKWAITMNDTDNKFWVCIGDINRADTQFRRGGGTVCLNSSHLWENYRNSVTAVEPCPRGRPGLMQRVQSWFKSKFSRS